MNKNHQVKSVLYTYILRNNLYETEKNAFGNNQLSIYYRDLKINKSDLILHDIIAVLLSKVSVS